MDNNYTYNMLKDLIGDGMLNEKSNKTVKNISGRLKHFKDFTPLQKKTFFGEYADTFWDTKKHLLVRGATSSGKTLVAETAMMDCLYGSDKTVIYLTPLRAMVSEKYRQFSRDFSGLDVFASDKDHQNYDFEITEGQFSVAVIVYEKFYAFLAQGNAKKMLKNCGLIVFDEVQLISQDDRGVKILMSLVNALTVNPDIRTVLLTTSFSDMSKTVGLLNSSINDHYYEILDSQNSMALEEIVIDKEGRYRGKYRMSIDDVALDPFDREVKLRSKADELGSEVEDPDSLNRMKLLEYKGDKHDLRAVKQNLLLSIINEHKNKKIIVFINSRTVCKRLADSIARSGILRKRSLPYETIEELESLAGISHLEEFKNELLPYGVAYHHGGLCQGLRDLIEDDFARADGAVNVILATETLAVGINLPADVIVVYDTEKHENDQPVSIDTQTYKNYIGRAGRLGMSDASFVPKSYLLAVSNRDMSDYWDKYITAAPTPIVPAYEKLKFDTALPFFLSMLSNQAYTVESLDDIIHEKMPKLGKINFFEELLSGNLSAEFKSKLSNSNFPRVWQFLEILNENQPDEFEFRFEPTYNLSLFGKQIIPYALSIMTNAQIWTHFIKTGDKNLISRFFKDGVLDEDAIMIPMLFLVCRMKEVESIHRIRVSSFSQKPGEYHKSREVISKYVNRLIDDKLITSDSDIVKLCSEASPHHATLTAAYRAFILDLWVKGITIPEIKSRIGTTDHIEEGDVERLAEGAAFLVESIAVSLQAQSDNKMLRRLSPNIRKISNRIKYGGDDDVVRILNCHIPKLTRNTLLSLKKGIKDELLSDESIFDFFKFASDVKGSFAITYGITGEQYNSIHSILSSRYTLPGISKLLFNLKGDGYIPSEFEECLQDNTLNIENTEKFLHITADYRKMPYTIIPKYTDAAGELNDNYGKSVFCLRSGYLNAYCIVVNGDAGRFISQYRGFLKNNPGKVIIIAKPEVLEEISKHLDNLSSLFKLSDFTLYTPESILRLYLKCLSSKYDEDCNLFLYNLQTLSGLVESNRIEIVQPPKTVNDKSGFDVFISYSHHKNFGIQSDVFNELSRLGYNVFLDNVSIHTGESFSEKIALSIRNSAKFLILSCEEYKYGKWTKDELVKIYYENVERGKPVVPIFLDDAGYEFFDENGHGDANGTFVDRLSRAELMNKIISALK